MVSTSTDPNFPTDGKHTDGIFKFESVAVLEILGPANDLDEGQGDVKDDAQLVEGVWIIQ